MRQADLDLILATVAKVCRDVPTEAADAAYDGVVDAMLDHRGDGIEFPAAFGATVARCDLTDWFDKQTTRRLYLDRLIAEFDLDGYPENQELPPDVAEANEERRTIYEFVSALPPDQRLVIDLRFFRDMTYDAIKAVTGWPRSTVQSINDRGLRRLRQMFDAHERGAVEG